MESAFLMNFGSNITTLGLALAVYVAYKRCVHSKCAIHSSWLECESLQIQEIKQKKAIALFKTAMGEYEQETQRYNKNGRLPPRIRIENGEDLQGHEGSRQGETV